MEKINNDKKDKTTKKGLVQVAEFLTSFLGKHSIKREGSAELRLIRVLNKGRNFENFRSKNIFKIRIINEDELKIWDKVTTDPSLYKEILLRLEMVRSNGTLVFPKKQSDLLNSRSRKYISGVNTQR